MLDKGLKTKLKLKRKFKKRQKQVAGLGVATEDSFDRYVARRLHRLWNVRRFVVGWFGLMLVMGLAVFLQAKAMQPLYLRQAPASGGIIREGMVGKYTNSNPMYAQSEADLSVSKLIFAGLFAYDAKGELKPNLAENYKIDESGTVYTVTLKQGLKWHDGAPLTAKDVAYTYNTIKDPRAKSYLLSSWRGVDISATDDHTVVFTLSTALSAFPHSLTTGIVPEHILKSYPVSQLRSVRFNNQIPIGSGPFKFYGIEQNNKDAQKNTSVILEANSDYIGGRPKVEKMIVSTYNDESSLIDAFKARKIDTISGLRTVPDGLDGSTTKIYNVPISAEVMVFFRNNQEILKDVNVRKALVLAIDKNEALSALKYPVSQIDEPLLSSQLGYDKKYSQSSNKKEEAKSALEADNWKADTSGIRSKDGQKLKFKLVSSNNAEYVGITANLQKQWRDIGAEVEVVLQGESELQNTVSTHNYDSLLYGISIGADPDVYAYWHSSQSDIRSETRLNLSEYKSDVANKALEAGRTRIDETNRSIKYVPFLEAWQKDYPALALYQQQYVYIVNRKLGGFNNEYMHTSVDRYADIVNWSIRSSLQKIN